MSQTGHELKLAFLDHLPKWLISNSHNVFFHVVPGGVKVGNCHIHVALREFNCYYISNKVVQRWSYLLKAR